MPEPTASVYRERGRVWIRLECDEHEYAYLRTVLFTDAKARAKNESPRKLYNAFRAGEREKADRSDILSRFDDAPKLGG